MYRNYRNPGAVKFAINCVLCFLLCIGGLIGFGTYPPDGITTILLAFAFNAPIFALFAWNDRNTDNNRELMLDRIFDIQGTISWREDCTGMDGYDKINKLMDDIFNDKIDPSNELLDIIIKQAEAMMAAAKNK